MKSQENQSALWLKRLLFLAGGMLLLAVVPIFFPVSLMAQIHGLVGLGEFPEDPIVLYLARSTSLLYAVHGSVMLTVALNLNRYQGMVPLLGWLHIVIGIAMLGIDLTAPMPWYWTAFEGGPIALGGVLILWLNTRAFPGQNSTSANQ
ncbi:MAG: hypothetical protein AAF456_09900 [Planctomycetota bacterium]